MQPDAAELIAEVEIAKALTRSQPPLTCPHCGYLLGGTAPPAPTRPTPPENRTLREGQRPTR